MKTVMTITTIINFGGLSMDKLYAIKSAIIGHAVGDALGVPVEFASREELKVSPITKMEGFGTYPFPAGSWSDDTSMTIASLDSLINGIDYEDMMYKFCQWLYQDKYTPSDECFDVGNTTSYALHDYWVNKIKPLECGGKKDYNNGNGSLMRILPIALYCELSSLAPIPISDKIKYIDNVSALTHGHSRSFVGCGIYTFVVSELLKSNSKDSVYEGISKAKDFYKNNPEYKAYSRIFDGDIKNLSEIEVNSGGYVVSCLEASLWCLLNTDSYKDCVLKAVNLGDDTDTTAAVAGGLAGLMYGYDSIPKDWLNTLIRKDYIEDLCEKAASKW